MIYSRDHLENLANNINTEFFPERMSVPSALDPYDLLEAIGCDYEWKYITPDDSIAGLTFFADGEWPTWPNGTLLNGDIPSLEFFKEGTIVINQRILDTKNKNARCSERFIVVHEAAHWLKDKDYYEKHPDNFLKTCYKYDFEKTLWNTNMTELDIIERQANYLSAAINMPKKVVIEAFFKAGRYKHIPNTPIEFKSYMKAWIAEVANKFGMNFNPVKYRLKDLNVISE